MVDLVEFRRKPAPIRAALVLLISCPLAVAAAQSINLGTTGSLTGQTTAVSSTSAVDPYTVRGKVVNALTGAGIARVLVNLSSRRVLTDPQGNFEFPGYTLARGSVSFSKPGFSNSVEGAQQARLMGSQDLSSPLELKLYPNPILTGIITGRDGLPIAGAQVRIVMASLDTNGLRWINAGASQTNIHGEYRFNPAPGRYRVNVGYLARTRETGEVILPVSFPELSSTEAKYIVLGPGQERRIDLQPRTGIPYAVALHVEPTQRNVRFTVTGSSGDSFTAQFEQSGEAGDFRLTLPSGAFQIRAHQDSQDASEEGSTRITVTAKGAIGSLQLAPLTSLPVEMVTDPADAAIATATSSTQAVQQPSPRQFNLSLRNEKNFGDGVENDVPLLGGNGNVPFSFRVPPGRYRLVGSQAGAWHVESVTYGQTNLLNTELIIGQGSGGAPIRIVADNQTGMVQGTVRLPPTLASAYVYLIPQNPVLSAPNSLFVGLSASFSGRIPLGSYAVVAVDHPLHMDLRDPDAAKNFSAAKLIEITANSTATLDLDLSEEKGANP